LLSDILSTKILIFKFKMMGYKVLPLLVVASATLQPALASSSDHSRGRIADLERQISNTTNGQTPTSPYEKSSSKDHPDYTTPPPPAGLASPAWQDPTSPAWQNRLSSAEPASPEGVVGGRLNNCTTPPLSTKYPGPESFNPVPQTVEEFQEHITTQQNRAEELQGLIDNHTVPDAVTDEQRGRLRGEAKRTSAAQHDLDEFRRLLPTYVTDELIETILRLRSEIRYLKQQAEIKKQAHDQHYENARTMLNAGNRREAGAAIERCEALELEARSLDDNIRNLENRINMLKSAT
jgi:ribosomal protein L19E